MQWFLQCIACYILFLCNCTNYVLLMMWQEYRYQQMVTIKLSFLLHLLHFAVDGLDIHRPAASPFWSAAKALSIATERSWQYIVQYLATTKLLAPTSHKPSATACVCSRHWWRPQVCPDTSQHPNGQVSLLWHKYPCWKEKYFASLGSNLIFYWCVFMWNWSNIWALTLAPL